MVNNTYNEFRKYSDKSLPEAKQYISKFFNQGLSKISLVEFIKESGKYDDTINAIDLFVNIPEFKITLHKYNQRII